MKHFNVIFKPDGKKVSIHAGATLLEAASQAGIVLNSVCGGKGICKKCVVTVQPDERAYAKHHPGALRTPQQVLACQYQIQSDIIVTVPATSRFFEQKILASGIEGKPVIQPDIYKKYLKIASSDAIFGLAVDIGTTTIVAKLMNMRTAQTLATQTALNPQSQFGDDVISRISYAQTDANLAQLHKLIIDCINRLIVQLCQQAQINTSQIYEVAVVGNTTMNHIFLKLPIVQLGQAPYRAYRLDACDMRPGDLALQINPAGNVHTVANIAGFVGADITAVVLAIDIESADEVTLAIDIGTNGEVILAAGNQIYAASCAAGPAFEGARISCGSRAQEGAIEAVVLNDGDIDLDVIGNGLARSICGSGLIDAVAVMLDLGVINSSGRFVKPDELKGKVSAHTLNRIIEQDGQPAFVLAGNKDALGQKVVLTQADIRQVQLAKAAIRAGIELLLKKVGLENSDIKRIFLAGAFGNYIRPESALRIGLLPFIAPERIIFVGNAACSGAQMILLSQQYRQKARQLASKIQYLEIANQPDFQDVFTDCLSF